MKIQKSKGLVEAQAERMKLVKRYAELQTQREDTKTRVEALAGEIALGELDHKAKMQAVILGSAKPDEAAKLKKATRDKQIQCDDLCDFGEALVEALDGIAKSLSDSGKKIAVAQKQCMYDFAQTYEWLPITQAVEDYLLKALLCGESIDGAAYQLEHLGLKAAQTVHQRYQQIVNDLEAQATEQEPTHAH